MEPDVVISLPADASPDLIARLAAAFPEARLQQPDATPANDYGLSAVDAAVSEAVVAAPRLTGLLAEWWAGLPLAGWGLLAVMAGLIGATWALERLAAHYVPNRAGAEPPPDFIVRAPRALGWIVLRLVLVVLSAVLAMVAFRVIVRPDAAVLAFFGGVLAQVVRIRATLLLIGALTAPGAPGRRLMGLTGEAAEAVYGTARAIAGVLLGIGLLREIVVAAGGVAPATELPKLGLIVLNGLATAWFFLRIAAPIREMLLRSIGAERAARNGVLTRLASNWAFLYIAAVLLDMAMKAIGVLGLLGPAASQGTGQAVLLMNLAPLAFAGLRVWSRETAARSAAAGAPRGGLFFGLTTLAEGVLLLLVGGQLLRSWGIDPLNPPETGGIATLVPGLVRAAITLVVGFALWQAVGVLLTASDLRADEELTDDERQSRRRLATILPVLRGGALAAIGVLTVMSALSALGMDIAPLIASAGVLGLAIGFGAQRLVADVISGLLYLYEDAFRIGEYIEVQGGKGVVERISIRSVRLRHPRGAVYTIPFSAMGTVQNHSRDFVTMKFNFAVPADTDLEKVRKLVKKAGQTLLEDPEIKDSIIEPLKSQGAIGIQGASYQIGIKFTAKPGQQWAVRRKAFIVLSEAFKENGIKLFAPQLTLNPANPAQPLQPFDQPAGQPG